MDMSGMDMGMSMDGGSEGMFTPDAIAISHDYWYIIAAFCAIGLFGNVYTRINARRRLAAARADPASKPTIPRNSLSQTYATVVTLLREASYPQGLYVTKTRWAWLTPPSLGRCLVLGCYWITVIVMLVTNSVVQDPYYYERLAFRAAWISVMQIPLIVLLSTKINIVGLLIGTSYEKLNWLHRWVSRTLFVTGTIHGALFWAEWARADFIADEMDMMGYMLKYGIGAWFVLLWMIISGALPLRSFCYEFYVVQHIVSAVIFIWLIYKHVPTYALLYLWMTIAFLALDRVLRWAWFAVRNVNLFKGRGVVTRLADRVGYRAELKAVPGDTTTVTIKNVPFKWRAGQHIYLGIPALGVFEAHPFTIANTSRKESGAMSEATIAVRAFGGFSKRLNRYAIKAAESGKSAEVRAFIQGPYGAHPTWNTFDTVVLISASTGCSFTLPILEEIMQTPGCVKHVTFLLLVRHRPQCACYLQRLREAAAQAMLCGLDARIQVVVTGQTNGEAEVDAFEGPLASRCVCGPTTKAEDCCCGSKHTGATSKDGVTISAKPASGSDSDSDIEGGALASCCAPKPTISSCCSPPTDDIKAAPAVSSYTSNEKRIATTTATPLREHSTYTSNSSRSSSDEKLSMYSSSNSSTKGSIEFSTKRPELADYIREPIERATGETCVAVCGGKSLTGHVRNVVAALSDERAVHKGTGAQGIFLHAEEFGW